jgi:hypothetical protein
MDVSTGVAAKSLCSGRGDQPLLAYVATLSPSNRPFSADKPETVVDVGSPEACVESLKSL